MGKQKQIVKKQPVVEEPQSVGFWNPFSGLLDSFWKTEPELELNKFTEDFGNFQKNFSDLESKLMKKNKMEGYEEIRSYTTYKQMDKNGKVVKADEIGTHYKYNNGEGFVKAIKKTPDGRVHEYIGEFDVMKKLK